MCLYQNYLNNNNGQQLSGSSQCVHPQCTYMSSVRTNFTDDFMSNNPMLKEISLGNHFNFVNSNNSSNKPRTSKNIKSSRIINQSIDQKQSQLANQDRHTHRDHRGDYKGSKNKAHQYKTHKIDKKKKDTQMERERSCSERGNDEAEDIDEASQSQHQQKTPSRQAPPTPPHHPPNPPANIIPPQPFPKPPHHPSTLPIDPTMTLLFNQSATQFMINLNKQYNLYMSVTNQVNEQKLNQLERRLELLFEKKSTSQQFLPVGQERKNFNNRHEEEE